MIQADWPRRRVLAGSAAFGLAGCTPLLGKPLVTINLTDPAPPPPGSQNDAGAHLDTALDESRRMTVPVRVNGHGPFQFVVDTGANRSVIGAEIAERLRLPAAGTTPVHGIAGVEPANLFKVARMQVGRPTPPAWSSRASPAPSWGPTACWASTSCATVA